MADEISKGLKLLGVGHTFKMSIIQNPSSIDCSKELLKLLEEETNTLEMIRLYSYRLELIRNRIHNLQDKPVDFLFKYDL